MICAVLGLAKGTCFSGRVGQPWHTVASPQVFRFLRNPHKPVVLAMSRPDAKKNVVTLIRAYGESKVLRELANLVLILGNRDSLSSMTSSSQSVMRDVMR